MNAEISRIRDTPPGTRSEADKRKLVLMEIAKVVASGIDIREDIAEVLVERAAGLEPPSEGFFTSLLPARPVADLESAAWQEYVEMLAMLLFFWSRSQTLFALHTLLEAAAIDGVTEAAAAGADEQHCDVALSVRQILRKHVLDWNTQPVSGPGLRDTEGDAPAMPAGAGDGGDTGAEHAGELERGTDALAASEGTGGPLHSFVPVAGRGLICALVSGVVALSRDVWHARASLDALRTMRADFDRVRAARCISQALRVFEPRLTPNLGLRPGQGGFTAEEWPEGRSSPLASVRYRWLPADGLAGELGLLTSLVRWVSDSALQWAPDQLDRSADAQVLHALLMAVLAACPDADSALLAPRRSVDGFFADDGDGVQPVDLLQAGAGEVAWEAGEDLEAAAPGDEILPAALAQMNDGQGATVAGKSLVSRQFRARAVCEAIAKLACEDRGEFIRAVCPAPGRASHTLWPRLRACCQLALAGCVVHAMRVIPDEGEEGGRSTLQRRCKRVLDRLLQEAQGAGAFGFLAQLCTSQPFQAAETAKGWAMPRIMALAAEALSLHLNRQPLGAIYQSLFLRHPGELAAAATGRGAGAPIVRAGEGEAAGADTGMHAGGGHAPGDSILDTAALLTVLCRADPRLCCSLLHPSASVEDAAARIAMLRITGAEAAMLDEDPVGGTERMVAFAAVATASKLTPGLAELLIDGDDAADAAVSGAGLQRCFLALLLHSLAGAARRATSLRADRERHSAAVRRDAAAAAAGLGGGLGRWDEDEDGGTEDDGVRGGVGGRRGRKDDPASPAELPPAARLCLAAANGLLAAVATGPLCADGHSCAAHVAAIVTHMALGPVAGRELSLAATLNVEQGVGMTQAGRGAAWGDMILLPALLTRISCEAAVRRDRAGNRAHSAARAREAFVSAVSTVEGEQMVLCDLSLLQSLLCDQTGAAAVAVAGIAAAAMSSTSLLDAGATQPRFRGWAAGGVLGASPQSALMSATSSSSSSSLSLSAGAAADVSAVPAEAIQRHGIVFTLLDLVRLPVTRAIKAAALKTLGVASRQQHTAQLAWKALERARLLPTRVAIQTPADAVAPAAVPQGLHRDLHAEARQGHYSLAAGYCSALQSLFAHPNSDIVTASLGLGLRDPRSTPLGATVYVDHLVEEVLPTLLRVSGSSAASSSSSSAAAVSAANGGPAGSSSHRGDGSDPEPRAAAWPAIAHCLGVLYTVLRGYAVVNPAPHAKQRLAVEAIGAYMALDAEQQEELADFYQRHPLPPLGSPPSARVHEPPGLLRGVHQRIRLALCGSAKDGMVASDPQLDFCKPLMDLWALACGTAPLPRSPGFSLMARILRGEALRAMLVSLLRAAGGAAGAHRAASAAVGFARPPHHQRHDQAATQMANLREQARLKRRAEAQRERARWASKLDGARRTEREARAAAHALVQPTQTTGGAMFAAPVLGQNAGQPSAEQQQQMQAAVAAAHSKVAQLEAEMPREAASRPSFIGKMRDEAVVKTAIRHMMNRSQAARRGGRSGSADLAAAALVAGVTVENGWDGERSALHACSLRAARAAEQARHAALACATAGDPLAMRSGVSGGDGGGGGGAAALPAALPAVPLTVWRDRSLILACGILEEASRISAAFLAAARAAGVSLGATSMAEGLIRESAVLPIASLAGMHADCDGHVALAGARLLARLITPDTTPGSPGLMVPQLAGELGAEAATLLSRRVQEAHPPDVPQALEAQRRVVARSDALGDAPWPALSSPDAPMPMGLDDTAWKLVGPGMGLGVRPELAGRPLSRCGEFFTIAADTPRESQLLGCHVPFGEQNMAKKRASATIIFTLLKEAESASQGQPSLAPLVFGLTDSRGTPLQPAVPSRPDPHGRRRRVRLLDADGNLTGSVSQAPAPLLVAVVMRLVGDAVSGWQGIHCTSPQQAQNLFLIVLNLCSAPGIGPRMRQFLEQYTSQLLAPTAHGGGSASAPGFFALQLRAFYAAMEARTADLAAAEAHPALSAEHHEAAQLAMHEARALRLGARTPAEAALARAAAEEARACIQEHDEARLKAHVLAEAVETMRTSVGHACRALALEIAAMCRQHSAPLRELTTATTTLLEPAPLPPSEDEDDLGMAGGIEAAVARLHGIGGREGVEVAVQAAAGLRDAAGESAVGGAARVGRPLLEALLRAAPLREDRDTVLVPPLLRSTVLAFETAAARSGEVGTARAVGDERVLLYDEETLRALARAAAYRQLLIGLGIEPTSRSLVQVGSASRLAAETAADGAATSDDDERLAWAELVREVQQEADEHAASAQEQSSAARQAATVAAMHRHIGAVENQAMELARARNHAVNMLGSGLEILRGWRQIVSVLMLLPRARLAFGAVLAQVPLAAAFSGPPMPPTPPPQSSSRAAVGGHSHVIGRGGGDSDDDEDDGDGAGGEYHSGGRVGGHLASGAGDAHGGSSKPFAAVIDDAGAETSRVPHVAQAILLQLLEAAAEAHPSPSAVLDEVALAALPLTAGMRAGRAPAPLMEHTGDLLTAIARVATAEALPSITPRGPSRRARGALYTCVLHLMGSCGFAINPGSLAVAGCALGNAGLAPVCFGTDGATRTRIGVSDVSPSIIAALPADAIRRLLRHGVRGHRAAAIIAAARGRLRQRDGTWADRPLPQAADEAAREAAEQALLRWAESDEPAQGPSLASLRPEDFAARPADALAGARARAGTARGAGVPPAEAAAAAERLRHENAAAYAACGEALAHAGLGFLDRVCQDATAGPCIVASGDEAMTELGVVLPQASTREAALVLLGSVISAPGWQDRLGWLSRGGRLVKLAAGVIEADSIEDATLRRMGTRAADGFIPDMEEQWGQEDGPGAKRSRHPQLTATRDPVGGEREGKEAERGAGELVEADEPRCHVLDRLFSGAGLLGAGAVSAIDDADGETEAGMHSRTTMGTVQALFATAASPADADRALDGLSEEGVRQGRLQAEANVIASLWALSRVAVPPTGARALVACGAITALSGMRWLRWARVAARDFLLSRQSATDQRLFAGRLRWRLTAILQLLLAINTSLRGDALAINEVRESAISRLLLHSCAAYAIIKGARVLCPAACRIRRRCDFSARTSTWCGCLCVWLPHFQMRTRSPCPRWWYASLRFSVHPSRSYSVNS